MGGKSFAFISHRGIVQICGFLEAEAGDMEPEARSERPELRRIERVTSSPMIMFSATVMTGISMKC